MDLSKETIELAIKCITSEYAIDSGTAKNENLHPNCQWFYKQLAKKCRSSINELRQYHAEHYPKEKE
jgi:hypothetical protein